MIQYLKPTDNAGSVTVHEGTGYGFRVLPAEGQGAGVFPVTVVLDGGAPITLTRPETRYVRRPFQRLELRNGGASRLWLVDVTEDPGEAVNEGARGTPGAVRIYATDWASGTNFPGAAAQFGSYLRADGTSVASNNGRYVANALTFDVRGFGLVWAALFYSGDYAYAAGTTYLCLEVPTDMTGGRQFVTPELALGNSGQAMTMMIGQANNASAADASLGYVQFPPTFVRPMLRGSSTIGNGRLRLELWGRP